jgi:hypothetical protein
MEHITHAELEIRETKLLRAFRLELGRAAELHATLFLEGLERLREPIHPETLRARMLTLTEFTRRCTGA